MSITFYNATYWVHHMELFESDDVEKDTVKVDFKCDDSTTTTKAAAKLKMKSTWDTAISGRHKDADDAEIPGSETYARGVSNPEYAPIRNAIPNP